MKKEENYTQVSATVNMEKINGKWQIKDLNEQIKNIEIIGDPLSINITISDNDDIRTIPDESPIKTIY